MFRETLEWRFRDRVEISRCERLGGSRAGAVKAVRKEARAVSTRCILLMEVVVSKVKGRVGFRRRMHADGVNQYLGSEENMGASFLYC